MNNDIYPQIPASLKVLPNWTGLMISPDPERPGHLVKVPAQIPNNRNIVSMEATRRECFTKQELLAEGWSLYIISKVLKPCGKEQRHNMYSIVDIEQAKKTPAYKRWLATARYLKLLKDFMAYLSTRMATKQELMKHFGVRQHVISDLLEEHATEVADNLFTVDTVQYRNGKIISLT